MSDETRRASEPVEDPQKIATGMTLADISIRNHVFAWILMIALIGFGILCFTGVGTVFKGLGVSQNPDVDFPVINISITWEGASPEIMETDVVDLVEDAVTSVEGVKEISSSSRQGSGNITVEFELERDIDVALQDVQAKLSQLQRRLPLGIDPAIVSKSNPEDEPIMRIAIGGSRPPTFVADYIRNVVRPQIQTIPGVGEIQLQGFRDRNVRVWYDAVRLEAQGLTVSDVNRAIQREHLEVPAGRIEGAEREMNVRAEGEAIDVEGFRNLVVTYRNGAPVRLRDVAVVEDGLEDRRRLARTNGQPAIGFGITKLRGANAVQVGRDVRARLAEIEKQLPEGLFLAVNFDTTVFIERAINEILFTLILAALLTSMVCWIFLGSWSTTLNVLLAIPTSILGTFIVMYVFGFTLNTYTVLGLTLVVGIVVDDAIMVLENIYRHREQGEGKVTAASVGAREITFAAAAATLAIMAIFLPVAFMKGIIGKFFFQFGVTITVAVLISLLEALTLAPMRLSRMLEVGERAGRLERWVTTTFARLAAGYQRLLVPALRHRKLVLAGVGRPLRALPGDRQAPPAGVHPLAGHEPVRDPVPDPRGVEPRHQRSHPQPDRARPPVAARCRHVRRLRGWLRRRRGQQRLPLRDHEGAGRPSGGPDDREAALAERADGRHAAGHERPSRGPDRDAGLLAAGLQRRPRRRLPRGVQHPRPRLGRARPRLSRDHGEDAGVGPGDRHQQRLPGRHAGGAGGSRPEQGGRPRHLHGRHWRHRQLGDRRGAHRQVQGQGAAVRHPGPAPRAPERASGGHPAAPRPHRRRGARAPGRRRAHRATAHSADDHAPRPRARDHADRERRPRGVAEPRHRPLDAARAGGPARRLPCRAPPAPRAPSARRSSRSSSP